MAGRGAVAALATARPPCSLIALMPSVPSDPAGEHDAARQLAKVDGEGAQEDVDLVFRSRRLPLFLSWRWRFSMPMVASAGMT